MGLQLCTFIGEVVSQNFFISHSQFYKLNYLIFS